MTRIEGKTAGAVVKELLLQNPGGLREVVCAVMQEVLEAEMTETLGAEKGERKPERMGYRSGSYGRALLRYSASVMMMMPTGAVVRQEGGSFELRRDSCRRARATRCRPPISPSSLLRAIRPATSTR